MIESSRRDFLRLSLALAPAAFIVAQLPPALRAEPMFHRRLIFAGSGEIEWVWFEGFDRAGKRIERRVFPSGDVAVNLDDEFALVREINVSTWTPGAGNSATRTLYPMSNRVARMAVHRGNEDKPIMNFAIAGGSHLVWSAPPGCELVA